MKIAALVFMVLFATECQAQQLTASYYSVESTKREGTWQKWSGRTASGEVFNDQDKTCASWDYKYGTILLVKNLRNGKTVKVRVTDRGPAKRLYRMGRVIDLSKGAMRQIDGIKSGVIPVSIEVIR